MFNSNDILARLQNGEDVNAIANEMADALNKANKAYEDEKNKKAAELQKEEDKKNDLLDILTDLTDWLNAHYDAHLEDPTMEDVDMALEAIDGLRDLIDMLDEIKTFPEVKKDKQAAKPQYKNSDQKIADFLSQMGW